MKTFNIMKQQGIVLGLVIELTKMLDREDLTDEGYKLIDELGDKIDNITGMLLDARCNNKISFWTASVLNLFNINNWIKVIRHNNYVRKSYNA